MSGRHGNSNASHRRKLAQEALRLKIDGEKCIDELNEVAIEAITCEPSDVPALRLRADIADKKLKKVLPDLRSVEITSDRSDQPEEMTDEEIAARLNEVARLRAELAGRSANKEGSPSEPTDLH